MKTINYKLIFVTVAALMMVMSAIILIPRASAIGIVPGRTTLDFSPGMEKAISFSVVNNEQKPLQVSLSVQGELSKFVTLSETSAKFFSTEEQKDFTYNLKLPDSLEPGLHTAEIIALDVPEQEGGSHVGATVAVVSQLYVYVPCPGKCINIDMDVLGADQNSTATFIVPVINRGKLRIEDAKATIDVYSGSEKVATIETTNFPIEPGARTELSGSWDVSVPRGDYKAKVTVVYDGQSKSFEKEFTVGTTILDISRVLVSDFSLGGIAKFRILIENKWNQELQNVFANLLIFSKNNEVMSDLKSSSENIPALGNKELFVYWDTAGIEAGEYNGKLMIKHGTKSTDKQLVLRVSQNSLDVLGAGFVVSEASTGTSIKTILLIIVILLVITNLAWFVFFKKLRKKQK